MPTKAEIGLRIRMARKRRGWSQKHLAEVVGTGRRHVIRWENGENTPTHRFRSLLSETLGVDFSDLDEDPEDAELLGLFEQIAEIRARRRLGASA